MPETKEGEEMLASFDIEHRDDPTRSEPRRPQRTNRWESVLNRQLMVSPIHLLLLASSFISPAFACGSKGECSTVHSSSQQGPLDRLHLSTAEFQRTVEFLGFRELKPKDFEFNPVVPRGLEGRALKPQTALYPPSVWFSVVSLTVPTDRSSGG